LRKIFKSNTFSYGAASAVTTQRIWQLSVTGATKNSVAKGMWILEATAITIVEN
jgi:hypothetical protein